VSSSGRDFSIIGISFGKMLDRKSRDSRDPAHASVRSSHRSRPPPCTPRPRRRNRSPARHAIAIERCSSPPIRRHLLAAYRGPRSHKAAAMRRDASPPLRAQRSRSIRKRSSTNPSGGCPGQLRDAHPQKPFVEHGLQEIRHCKAGTNPFPGVECELMRRGALGQILTPAQDGGCDSSSASAHRREIAKRKLGVPAPSLHVWACVLEKIGGLIFLPPVHHRKILRYRMMSYWPTVGPRESRRHLEPAHLVSIAEPADKLRRTPQRLSVFAPKRDGHRSALLRPREPRSMPTISGPEQQGSGFEHSAATLNCAESASGPRSTIISPSGDFLGRIGPHR